MLSESEREREKYNADKRDVFTFVQNEPPMNYNLEAKKKNKKKMWKEYASGNGYAV